MGLVKFQDFIQRFYITRIAQNAKHKQDLSYEGIAYRLSVVFDDC